MIGTWSVEGRAVIENQERHDAEITALQNEVKVLREKLIYWSGGAAMVGALASGPLAGLLGSLFTKAAAAVTGG